MADVIRHHMCPMCSSADIERPIRQPREVLEHCARLLGWRVYRCRECGDLFYDSAAETEGAVAVLVTQRIIQPDARGVHSSSLMRFPPRNER